MIINKFKRISVEQLQTVIHNGSELALVDVREVGLFGEGHIFFAIPCPYSRLELHILSLVPRKTTTVVLVDDGALIIAERAADRLQELGYTNVSVLDGGNKAWAASGRRLFPGANVPCKAFGELVEHTYSTPFVTAYNLVQMKQAGEDFVLVDSRTWPEYHNATIPGSICVPSGELALRVPNIVKNPETKIVVCCGGRTRSIIGAQTLINFGLPNPIYSLRNGTQGWQLCNLQLEYGASRRYADEIDRSLLPSQQEAAKRIMARFNVSMVTAAEVNDWLNDSTRTTYLCDVRSEEEYAEKAIPGSVHAPGGQLLQAADRWIGVRNARIVLIDGGENVRAPVTGGWLRQLGYDPYVLDGGITSDLKGSSLAQLSLPDVERISVEHLRIALERNDCTVLDLRDSMRFRNGHLHGSRWSIRPRIIEDAYGVRLPIVLVSDSADCARLACVDLRAAGIKNVKLLNCSFENWQNAGYEIESSPSWPSDTKCIDYLFFLHDRHSGNRDAIRQYLAWEASLVEQLDSRDKASYRVGK